MSIQAIANSELAIIDLLWIHGKLTAREIREKLYSDTEKAQHGTVQRLLQRLDEKGFVDKDSSSYVHQFKPRIGRKAYAGMQLENLAETISNHFRTMFQTE